jgi:hypothetical protein
VTGLSSTMPPAAPRHFTPDAGVPGAGLPGDRNALLAARRALFDLKLAFLDALDSVGGQEAAWLRSQVRHADEPVDLWLLRAAVFAAIAGPERRPARQALRRALDGLFPDTQPSSGFSPF